MRRRTRTPGLVAVATLGLLGCSGGAVWAALPPAAGSARTATPSLGPTTSAPASTNPAPSTTGLFGATTTTVASTSSTSAATSTTAAGGTTTTTEAPSGGGDFNPLVGVVPPEDQAVINSFVPTPPGNNAALVAALAPLTTLGFTPTQALVAGSGRFPVAAPVSWKDSFVEPRFDAAGNFHFHHAIDIAAPCGTPLRAPDAGTLVEGSDPGGGTTVEITEPDGTYIYMAHLSAYAPGQAARQPVVVGDVVGAVGETGAATGCHVHIEIHPLGGDAVDPKPFIDAWYASALAAAPLVVAAEEADHGVHRTMTAPPAPLPTPPVTTPPAGGSPARVRAAALAAAPLDQPDRGSPVPAVVLLTLLASGAAASTRRAARRRRPGPAPARARGRPTR